MIQSSLGSKEEAPDQVQRHGVIVCADVRLTQLKAAAAINPFIVSSWRVVFDFTPNHASPTQFGTSPA